MPPNTQYDKIGLHRLVKPDILSKGAVFIDPGIYGSGEQLLSNPPSSNYSVDESSSQAIYWANRGFEVFSIDWRAHFLPTTMNSSQAGAFAANWGYAQYISDMKEAVDKAKELSGNSKIFLAGFSWGGLVAMFYASQYWQQDLKGLILLDGGENTIKSANVTNSVNATTIISSLRAAGNLVFEMPRLIQIGIPPSGLLFAYQNAVQNPGAPAEWPLGTSLQPTVNPLTNKPWTNITEYIAYQMYSTKYSNIYAGYGNISAIVQFWAGCDRYWPARLGAEQTAMRDWNNCPFIPYDFDDHYNEINVPTLTLRTEMWGIPNYGNYTNGMATTDFTQITLPNYGHIDVFTGTYSTKDVSQPVLDWMNRPFAASVSSSAASVQSGQSITFSASVTGGPGPYTYQWFEGSTALAGQTTPQLNITKTTPGTYTYFCSVNDSTGTATNSTVRTLAVTAAPTPTPTSTAVPTPVPTGAPTMTPKPTQTPTTTPTPIPTPQPTALPTATAQPTSTPSSGGLALTSETTYAIAAVLIVFVVVAAAVAIIVRRRANEH